MLEQIPVSSIGFTRLSDFHGSKRPDVKRVVIAADLSEDTLADEFRSLKLFLSSDDVLLIQDRDSYFSSSPDVFYQRGSLKDKLISILNSEKVYGEQFFFFQAPNKHIKST